jgi:hypothetical protein
VDEVTVHLNDADWTPTAVHCVAQQRFYISASGEGRHDGVSVGPAGLTDPDAVPHAYYEGIPTAAVIATLNDANVVEPIGAGAYYECATECDIRVSINDYLNLEANEGEFTVRIHKVSAE